MKKLSKLQKTTLIMLARKAFDRIDDGTGDFGEWRTQQAQIACGKRISEATNDDYNRLKSHFYNLGGNSGAAFKATMADGSEGTRRAMHNLEAALYTFGLKMPYAESICRDQFRCSLAQATAEQIEKVMFTVNTRGRSMVKRQRGGTRHFTDAANPITNEWEALAEK